MKQAFLQNVRALRLFDKNDKLLLAISGGVDSTVLAISSKCGFNFALAHCNFKLRGKERRRWAVCKQLAQKLGVAFYSSSFGNKNTLPQLNKFTNGRPRVALSLVWNLMFWKNWIMCSPPIRRAIRLKPSSLTCCGVPAAGHERHFT